MTNQRKTVRVRISLFIYEQLEQTRARLVSIQDYIELDISLSEKVASAEMIEIYQNQIAEFNLALAEIRD